jgi:hypothetical protein
MGLVRAFIEIKALRQALYPVRMPFDTIGSFERSLVHSLIKTASHYYRP